MRLLSSVALVLLFAAPVVAQPAATIPAPAQNAVPLEDFVQAAIQKQKFMDARIVVVVLANVNGPAADSLALTLMFAARGEAVSVIKDDAGALAPRK